jgi:hypothetical protein
MVIDGLIPTALAVDGPTQRSNHVMTGPDPVIVIGWLLIGIAPFAIGCG